MISKGLKRYSDLSLSLCLSAVLSVEQKQQLDGVVFSSRFALALFFPPDVVFSFPWAAKYVTNNRSICYIAADSRKRNAGLSVCSPVCLLTCLSAHLSVCSPVCLLTCLSALPFVSSSARLTYMDKINL